MKNPEYRRVIREASPARPVSATKGDIEAVRRDIDTLAQRDRDAFRRLKIHLACITAGAFASVCLTFIPGGWLLHFGPCLATAPDGVQAVIDWVRRW